MIVLYVPGDAIQGRAAISRLKNIVGPGCLIDHDFPGTDAVLYVELIGGVIDMKRSDAYISCL
jgi:hypothetical protein